MTNKQETLQEKMERLGYASKAQPTKQKKVKKQKIKKEKKVKKQKNKKRIAVALIALCLAATTAISGLVLHFNKKKNNNTNNSKNNSSISAVGDLGVELDFPKSSKPSLGETTGNVNVSDIVSSNGKYYANQSHADKADKVGTSSIDTKGDTLKVESNGTVKEKEEGYEIKDKETGSIIQSGNVSSDGSIEGFKKDENLGGYFEEEDDVETLVYSDANYYDKNGDLVLAKGDLVEEERLAYAKKHYSTTKPVVSSKTSTSSTVTSTPSVSSNTSSKPSVNSNTSSTTSTTDEGKVNADGTYTIFGLTFETKADYQQWVLQGYEGYAEADGIMKSESEIQKQIQKVK